MDEGRVRGRHHCGAQQAPAAGGNGLALVGHDDGRPLARLHTIPRRIRGFSLIGLLASVGGPSGFGHPKNGESPAIFPVPSGQVRA